MLGEKSNPDCLALLTSCLKKQGLDSLLIRGFPSEHFHTGTKGKGSMDHIQEDITELLSACPEGNTPRHCIVCSTPGDTLPAILLNNDDASRQQYIFKHDKDGEYQSLDKEEVIIYDHCVIPGYRSDRKLPLTPPSFAKQHGMFKEIGVPSPRSKVHRVVIQKHEDLDLKRHAP